MPAYIEERIRRAPPEGHFIVPQSTPVVAFGDATKARVATLGINPSNQEFCNTSGKLLYGKERRLATYESLKVNNLINARLEVVQQVLKDCNNYFVSGADYSWFKALSPYLSACEASYRSGSACHLDLVQWATEIKWSEIEKNYKTVAAHLIDADTEFLKQQLRCENIEILLINGAKVWKSLTKMLLSDIDYVEHDAVTVAENERWKFYSGSLFNKIKIIGWSANRQSSFITNRSAFDEEICRRISNIVAGRAVA